MFGSIGVIILSRPYRSYSGDLLTHYLKQFNEEKEYPLDNGYGQGDADKKKDKK
jgi:hypothetical protein